MEEKLEQCPNSLLFADKFNDRNKIFYDERIKKLQLQFRRE